MIGGVLPASIPRLVAGLALFVVLATLNSAGYRYGASDQAFYAPAVIHRLHPDYYPRDAALIRSQARLTLVDETIAPLVRLSGLSLPRVFAALYVVSLVLLALGALSLGRLYYRTTWAAFALAAAMTLRHAIAQTGTNTLEGYFHPRQLAFASGVWGLVLFLRGRGGWAAVPLAAGALVHPTTALWFIIWIGAAAVVSNARLFRPALAAGLAGAVLGTWALTLGPLAGRLRSMDAEWLETLADRRYLFPLEWPLSVWLLNLSYPVLIAWLYRRRQAAGLAAPRERGVVAGASLLLALFAVTLPFAAAHVQLAIQLQPARIFWMLDFLAVVYAVWAMAEGSGSSPSRARLVAGIICLASVARGAYVARIAFPDRPMFAIGLPDSDWGRVMRWARESTPPSSHWLADPLHAFRYGTSLRIAGHRDVLVEGSKDRAIGMYDRAVALRARDRIAAVGDFDTLTPARARELAAAYDLDYLVSEATLDLPVAFSSGELRVYELR